MFREVFEQREKSRLEIEANPGGVRVTETSDDLQVLALIRQHAHRAVSAFVRYRMPRAMQPTPLPHGYRERHAEQRAPATAGDAAETRRQIQSLQPLLVELERGRTSPQQVPQMCPMCQGMMGGMGGAPDPEEMEQGIQQQIRRLEERVRALERGRG